MNLETALRTAPLFAALDDRQRSRIGDLMTIRRFDPGTTILRQGTSAVALYLLLDGEVEVSREPEEGGRAVPLARLEPGDIFGEMAVLDDDTRSSSVTALAAVPLRAALALGAAPGAAAPPGAGDGADPSPGAADPAHGRAAGGERSPPAGRQNPRSSSPLAPRPSSLALV